MLKTAITPYTQKSNHYALAHFSESADRKTTATTRQQNAHCSEARTNPLFFSPPTWPLPFRLLIVEMHFSSFFSVDPVPTLVQWLTLQANQQLPRQNFAKDAFFASDSLSSTSVDLNNIYPAFSAVAAAASKLNIRLDQAASNQGNTCTRALDRSPQKNWITKRLSAADNS